MKTLHQSCKDLYHDNMINMHFLRVYVTSTSKSFLVIGWDVGYLLESTEKVAAFELTFTPPK